MTPPEIFSHLLRGQAPVLALAPMQDVTTIEFWRVKADSSDWSLQCWNYQLTIKIHQIDS